jgi:hypothetical protein
MSSREVSHIASIFGIVGTVSSQVMNLSALPSIVDICRARSTLLYPVFPFVIGLIAGLNGLIYCLITKQWIVVISTSMSLCFNVTYISVHLIFSHNRRAIYRLGLTLFALVAPIAGIGPLVACEIANTENCGAFAVDWIGVVNTVIYCFVYCGQLWTLREIIQTKNSGPISPWLTAGVVFCAAMWTTYSLLVPDYFYLVSSVVGDVSGLFQIGLLLKYPRKLPHHPTMDPPPVITIRDKVASIHHTDANIDNSPISG